MKLNKKKIFQNPAIEDLLLTYSSLNKNLILKDIYLTEALKLFAQVFKKLNINHYVLKGGTCLSKCYLQTKRLSEDIDINIYAPSNNKAQKAVRQLSKEIDAICLEKNIEVTHRDKIWGHPRNFMHAEFLHDGISFDIDVKSTIDNMPMNRFMKIEEHNVYSIVDKVSPNADQETFTFPCVDLKFLIAEKLIGFEKKFKYRDEVRSTRHMYDIYTVFTKGFIENTRTTWKWIATIYSAVIDNIEQRFFTSNLIKDNICFNDEILQNPKAFDQLQKFLVRECYEKVYAKDIIAFFQSVKDTMITEIFNRYHSPIVDIINSY